MTRETGATVVEVIAALGVVVACGNGKSPTSDCRQFADALTGLYTNCAEVTPSASAVAHLHARYDQLCQSALAMPGFSTTNLARSVACYRAAAADGCRNMTEGECAPSGTLVAGAPCNNGSQCQSGLCLMDPGATTPTCGWCAAVIPVGQPCDNGPTIRGSGGVCPSYQCDNSNLCTALNYGDVGSSCPCKSGLYCNPLTAKCTKPAGPGMRCTGNLGLWDCAYPLVCMGTSTPTCQNPSQAGAPCASGVGDAGDFVAVAGDCGSGLACDPSTHQCAAVSWASSGEPCGGLTHCLVGACFGGQCPRVLADGQPCSESDMTSTCDTLASCTYGTCTLTPSVVCK